MKENDSIHPNALEYEGYTERHANINGIDIYYECENVKEEKTQPTDTAVLLVHGWTANRFRLHPLYLHFVEKQVPVFRLDLRGHGWSQKDEGLDYSIPSFVEDLYQFMTQVILEKFGFSNIILIGHSMGGLICQGVLVEYNPEFIEKVILMCTFPYFCDNLIRKIGATLEIKGYKKDFMAKFNKKKVSEEKIGLEHFPQFSEKYSGDKSLVPSKKATIQTIESMKTYDLRKKIKNLDFNKPVFCIAAEKDILAHKRFSKWMAENYKNGSYCIIPEAEHNVDQDKPLSLRKKVDEFLGF